MWKERTYLSFLHHDLTVANIQIVVGIHHCCSYLCGHPCSRRRNCCDDPVGDSQVHRFQASCCNHNQTKDGDYSVAEVPMAHCSHQEEDQQVAVAQEGASSS